MILNNRWVNEEIKKEVKKLPWDKWKWKHNIPKSLGCHKSGYKKEVYSNTDLPQEARKISNNLTMFLKELEKEQKPKTVEGRK